MSILVQQFELSDVSAFQPLSSSITKRNWELRKACKSNNTKMHENTNEKILTEKDSRKWQAREELEKG